jgi:hypothetical protein
MGINTMQSYASGVAGEQRQFKASMWDGMYPTGRGAAIAALGGSAGGPGGGGSGGGPAMLRATLVLASGQVLMEALVPVAQENKMRYGTSGLS